MHMIACIGNTRPHRPNRPAIWLSAFFLFACNPNQPSPPTEFSNLTPLTGKRFVAYFSPDRRSKPDTVKVSVELSGMAINAMKAKVTIDSGDSWISLEDIIPESSSRATIRWIPGDDTVHFGYFGEKECFIRISDISSAAEIQSDSFKIIGFLPVILLSPKDGESFSMNDTIAINYQTNNDLISNIQVFFRNELMRDTAWEEIIARKLLDASTPPFRSLTALFYPYDCDTIITNHPEKPIRFLLKDYGSSLPNSSIISGGITLQP